MSEANLDHLPEPDRADLHEAAAEEELAMESTDGLAHPVDAPDAEEVELMEDAEQESVIVDSSTLDEDRSATDRLQDGALPEDLEQGNMGRSIAEADMADPSERDSIDDRIRQEEPEEGFDVVPGGDADDALGER